MCSSALRPFLVLLLATAAWGCADADPVVEACSVVAPNECLEPELRYASVAPIFESYCASCHTGRGSEPWPLDDYDSVADWADLLREELASCSMPPPGSSIPLGNRDRARILNWLRCGLPE